MTRAYTDIYITLLGADTVQLEIVNSISNVVAAGISAPVGWFQDRYSLKKIFIIGFAVSLLSTMIYGIAMAWTTIIFAMGLSALGGTRTSGASAIGNVAVKWVVEIDIS